MTKFFKKSKKPICGYFGPFLPKFGQKQFFQEKKTLSQFLSIPIIYWLTTVIL